MEAEQFIGFIILANLLSNMIKNNEWKKNIFLVF